MRTKRVPARLFRKESWVLCHLLKLSKRILPGLFEFSQLDWKLQALSKRRWKIRRSILQRCRRRFSDHVLEMLGVWRAGSKWESVWAEPVYKGKGHHVPGLPILSERRNSSWMCWYLSRILHQTIGWARRVVHSVNSIGTSSIWKIIIRWVPHQSTHSNRFDRKILGEQLFHASKYLDQFSWRSQEPFHYSYQSIKRDGRGSKRRDSSGRISETCKWEHVGHDNVVKCVVFEPLRDHVCTRGNTFLSRFRCRWKRLGCL